MTMKLIGGNAVDFASLNSIRGTHRSCEPHLHGTEPQEPIPVQVRIRQYADTLPEVRRLRADSPNLGQLPVGAILDCYI